MVSTALEVEQICMKYDIEERSLAEGDFDWH